MVPRMREVDEVLRNHEEARGIFYESHPELCFWALNGGERIGDSKKDEAGERKRERILRGFERCPVEGIIGDFEEEYESRGSMVSVGREDLYDALALALCASADEHEALPGEKADLEDVPRDDEGLPMRMVYARSESVLSV
jgi:predicted RNase H-like nuclease